MRLEPVLLLALLPPLHAQPGRFGLPDCSGPGLELAARHGFLVCYDTAARLPRWTAHELTPGQLGHPAPGPRPRFRPDTGLAHPTAANRDFASSGYTRGHLVPAADLAWSEAAYADSFLLSNVVPQPASVNNGIWRRLENATRRLLRHADAAVIITGTLCVSGAPERLGPSQVNVPAYTYKAILALAGPDKVMYAALIPNSTSEAPATLAAAATTVRELEQASGLDFFAALNDAEEHALESARNPLP